VRRLNYSSPQDQRVLKEDGNETRRKNVMTEFSNVYSTYSTSEFKFSNVYSTYSKGEMFGYRSSRRVIVIFNEHMIGK